MGRASEVRDRPLERTRQQRRARWRLLRARQAQMGFGSPYSVDMQPQLSFVSFTRVKSRVPAVPSCPGGTPVKQGKVSEEDPAEMASEASVELLTGVLNSEDLELAVRNVVFPTGSQVAWGHVALASSTALERSGSQPCGFCPGSQAFQFLWPNNVRLTRDALLGTGKQEMHGVGGEKRRHSQGWWCPLHQCSKCEG